MIILYIFFNFSKYIKSKSTPKVGDIPLSNLSLLNLFLILDLPDGDSPNNR